MNTLSHIKIVGAGQLGSRHLQALAKVQYPLTIEVIDPSSNALEVAHERYFSVATNTKHSISFHSQLMEIKPTDIAIIACNASIRKSLIETLLNALPVKHLVLEKILFTQEADYHYVNELIKTKKTKAWVNCCMRMMPFYQRLRSLFFGKSIHYFVQGSSFGLITNAIHYLDHMVYLTGCEQFTLNTAFLNKQILSSKREGYFELSGTLIVHFSNGSIATFTDHNEGIAPIQISINTPSHRVLSREWEQKAWTTNHSNNWKWTEVDAPIPFQSEMTTYLTEQLLGNGTCQLPGYEESIKTHLQLLNPLKEFLKSINYSTECDYPFT